MEVTSQEKESERRVIDASIGAIIGLAILYLVNKYGWVGNFIKSLAEKHPKALKNALKINEKLSDFLIFKDSDLFLYFLGLALVLYGIMNRSKSRLQTSQFEANIWLVVAGICFLILQIPDTVMGNLMPPPGVRGLFFHSLFTSLSRTPTNSFSPKLKPASCT